MGMRLLKSSGGVFGITSAGSGTQLERKVEREEKRGQNRSETERRDNIIHITKKGGKKTPFHRASA